MNLWINDINSEIINNFIIRKEDQLVFNKTNIFLGWQYQVNYIVSYYSEDFLSLLIRKDEYSISDKPDVSFSTSNIELKDNSFQNIKLSDLFLPNTDYIQKLSEYAMKDLLGQNALWIEDKKIRSLDRDFLNLFLVTEGYIEFAFPPGIVAPAEDGAYFVKIPYDYIAPYTNPSGLLNRFIKYNGINYLEFSPDKINR
ncbi:MAG: RsiV family protein [Bacteroidota bacterium]|nr:RsiV family protein [Bacteroidota bacterium]